MSTRNGHWVSAQVAAGILNTTSAEVCRLLSIGHLAGTKFKQPGRAGEAQWLVNPLSIDKERRLRAKYAVMTPRGKSIVLRRELDCKLLFPYTDELPRGKRVGSAGGLSAMASSCG